MRYILNHSLGSHKYILEYALQLSNAHVWVPPETDLGCLYQSKYLVEYSLNTSMTQSIVGIETGLLDRNPSLLLSLYMWS
jgi:hypothetical protein